MNRQAAIVFAFVASCMTGCEPTKPSSGSAPAPLAPVPSVPVAAAPSATPPAPAPKPWDVEHAHRVRLNDAPATIGDKPAKDPKLEEIAPRSPGLGDARPAPAAIRLPSGEAGKIPQEIDGSSQRWLSESNGRLLVPYGARYVLVAGAKDGIVEHLLTLDSPELPLSPKEREADNFGAMAYSDGTLFLCRSLGPNGAAANRLEAIDLTTGARRWQSPTRTCEGAQMAALGAYVVSVYDGHLKVIRRHDGAVVQTLKVPGRIPFLAVEGERLLVETSAFHLTYGLK